MTQEIDGELDYERALEREEFAAQLDQSRAEVAARREAVRRENKGRAMSPGRVKYLREIAAEKNKIQSAQVKWDLPFEEKLRQTAEDVDVPLDHAGLPSRLADLLSEEMLDQTDPMKSERIKTFYSYLDVDGKDKLGMTQEDYHLISRYFAISEHKSKKRSQEFFKLSRGMYDQVDERSQSTEYIRAVFLRARSWIEKCWENPMTGRHYSIGSGGYTGQDFDLILEHLISECLTKEPAYSSRETYLKFVIRDISMVRESRLTYSINGMSNEFKRMETLLEDAHMWKHGTKPPRSRHMLSEETMSKYREADPVAGESADGDFAEYTAEQVKEELDRIVESMKGEERARAIDEFVRSRNLDPADYKKYFTKYAKSYVFEHYVDPLLSSSTGVLAVLAAPAGMGTFLASGDPMMSFVFAMALIFPASIPWFFASYHVGFRNYAKQVNEGAEIPESRVEKSTRGAAEAFLITGSGKPAKTDPTAERLANAETELKEMYAVIASYETDVSKAISYPAFNDVGNRAVSTMFKQLRKCERALSEINLERDKNGRFSGDKSLVSGFVDKVDELVIDVESAKAEAERIAWSDVSESERSDLKTAQGLIAHASDPANTEDMRATFYAQLRRVVNRLNNTRKIIPTPIVGEIEKASMLLLEASVDNGASVSDVLSGSAVNKTGDASTV